MPESRKRKGRKPNTARQFLAARDGERIKIKACCNNTVIELGATKINVRHDRNCAALRGSSPNFVAARMKAAAAINEVLGDRGMPAVHLLVFS